MAAAIIAPLVGAVANKLLNKGGSGGGSSAGAIPGASPQQVQTPQPPLIGVSSPSLEADKAANVARMQNKYGYPGV